MGGAKEKEEEKIIYLKTTKLEVTIVIIVIGDAVGEWLEEGSMQIGGVEGAVPRTCTVFGHHLRRERQKLK